MKPPESEPEPSPRAPPAPATPRRLDSRTSGPDSDFDPDLDVAPVLRRPAERPELAAALASSDRDLQWGRDVQPSDATEYVKPTTLPRAPVAPTVDMAAVRVRDDVDPRTAVTMPSGLLPAPPRLETQGKRRAWIPVAGGIAALAIAGVLARAVTQGSGATSHDETEPTTSVPAVQPSPTGAPSSSGGPANDATASVSIAVATATSTGAAPRASAPSVDATATFTAASAPSVPIAGASSRKASASAAAVRPPPSVRAPPRAPVPAPTKDPDFW